MEHFKKALSKKPEVWQIEFEKYYFFASDFKL
jgi:hypothetical protein